MTQMDYQGTMRALKGLMVETGSLACLGCGYEYSCSAHGCAILRNAVEHMEAALANYGHLIKLTKEQAEAIKEYELALSQPSNEPLTGWVSVNKRLPEKRKDVLVHYGNGRIGIDWIDSTQCFVFDELYGRVTHWLPIPELPDRRPQEGEADGK